MNALLLLYLFSYLIYTHPCYALSYSNNNTGNTYSSTSQATGSRHQTSASVGIATGNLGAGGDNSVPSIARSQDGGKTWQTQTLPHLLGGFVNPYNTSQPPVFVGNVVLLPVQVSLQNGTAFVLYRSNDDGRNWVQTSTPGISANNTYVLDTTHAWATDTQSGKLYSTVDGGNNWSPTSNTAYALQALSFTDTQTGWGVSKAQLFHTTDGGKTWQQISYTIQ